MEKLSIVQSCLHRQHTARRRVPRMFSFPVVLPSSGLTWRPLHCALQAKIQWLHLDFFLRYTPRRQAAPSQIKEHLVALQLLHPPSGPLFTTPTVPSCSPVAPSLAARFADVVFPSRPFSSFTQVTYCGRSAGNTAGRVNALQFCVSFHGRDCLLQRRSCATHTRDHSGFHCPHGSRLHPLARPPRITRLVVPICPVATATNAAMSVIPFDVSSCASAVEDSLFFSAATALKSVSCVFPSRQYLHASLLPLLKHSCGVLLSNLRSSLHASLQAFVQLLEQGVRFHCLLSVVTLVYTGSTLPYVLSTLASVWESLFFVPEHLECITTDR